MTFPPHSCQRAAYYSSSKWCLAIRVPWGEGEGSARSEGIVECIPSGSIQCEGQRLTQSVEQADATRYCCCAAVDERNLSGPSATHYKLRNHNSIARCS